MNIYRSSKGGCTIKHFLDIREDVCPITFVKSRLLIEKMSPGDVAEILLRGVEPIENVPASVTELGHAIIDSGPLDTDPSAVRLVIRKN